ncbi:MAG: hypothetical protein ACRC33_13625, partial [Gemmataceae bacterium]
MVRMIVAVALTAVVQFAWGFTYFGVLGSMERMTARAPDEAAVTAALAKVLPADGTYILPGCPGSNAAEADMKAFEARAAAGPLLQIHFRKEGFQMAQMPAVMGTGFGLTVLTAILAAVMLRAALPGLPTYAGRVAFVTGIGVIAA